VQLPTQNALGKGMGKGGGEGGWGRGMGKGGWERGWERGMGNRERKVEQRENELAAMLAQRRVPGVPPSFLT